MKKIKKITLILIILITIIGITYRGKITAYAEKYDFNKIEINKVYNKGDILTIYDLEEIYSGSSYPAELSQMHVINYQDKAGNDLYIYFSGTFGSGVISLSSLTVGADLATGLKNNILELYNIMKKQAEDAGEEFNKTEAEFLAEYDNSLTGLQSEMLIYNDSSKDLQKIKKWQVVESPDKTLLEFCKNNDKAKDNTTCGYILEDYETITNSDGNYDMGYYEELFNSSVITLREYEDPEFTFECNPATIKYQEETKCNLKINTNDKIVEIKTNLNNSYLELKNINVKDGWTITKDDKGYYILKNEEGFSGEDVVLTTTLIAEENKNIQTNIVLKDLTYITATNQTKTISIPVDIRVESTEENPNTSDIRLIIVLIFLTSSSFFLIKTFHKKKSPIE